MAIIGVSGYSGVGKDTVGKLIQVLHCSKVYSTITIDDVLNDYPTHQWWLEEKSGWEIKKWAGKLKTMASLLTGIPKKMFEDQEFKHTELGPEWAYKKVNETGEYFDTRMTVRELLQRLGTDAMRAGLHENTWVNALMADYTPTQVQWSDGPVGGYEDGPMPNWVITDTRFPNEAKAIKDAGGIVIRVDRPGVKAVNTHPSETALDDWNFDYKIMNGSDIASLMFSLEVILEKEDLL
jgi:hypothetical protein